jgi:hypothetical protein
VASRERQHAKVQRLIEAMLVLIGLWLITVTVIDIKQRWSELDYGLLTQSLVLPVWLTIVSLPFIYVLALYSAIESALIRMKFANDRKSPNLNALLAVLLGLNAHVREWRAFSGYWAGKVASETSFRGALERVREYRRSHAQQRDEERQRKARLKRYAGVDGVDADGKQLAQREFEETKQALRWLATCQMGWYRNQGIGGRYRPDLLEILGSFSSQGLPEEHGIEMKVSKNAQACYAWRRTVTGMGVRIGASKEPPDQWLYDGPEPPKDFPSKSGKWVESTEANRPMNW